jgi:SAM-dependent methyltransferase
LSRTGLVTDYDELIRDHYTKEADAHRLAPTSTMADVKTRAMETEAVLASIGLARQAQPALRCLDVGCGNGYTLSVIASRYPSVECLGLEPHPALRELARSRGLNILEGDIRTAIPVPSPLDVVLSQRVFINLLDLDDQRRALDHVIAALRPGGMLIAVEAFEPQLEKLNQLRVEVGMDPIAPAYHNRYLPAGFFDHPALEPYPDPSQLIPPQTFLSTHYVVTRVLQPWLAPRVPRNSAFVEFFSAALAPAVGDFSPLKLCVLRRKQPRP